jgi:translation elongation factor P/translation initiation factor 5A
MITAGQFKKGTVITHDGVHWVVEDYHIHKTAQRRPVLQTKLRSLKTGHVVERAFDEADRFEQPDLQTRTCQFLYTDGSEYVFMDAETFDQMPVAESVVGRGKWLMREGTEFLIRLIAGRRRLSYRRRSSMRWSRRPTRRRVDTPATSTRTRSWHAVWSSKCRCLSRSVTSSRSIQRTTSITGRSRGGIERNAPLAGRTHQRQY